MNEITVVRAAEDDIPGLVECSIGLFAEDAGTRDPTMDTDWPRKHAAATFALTIHDESRLVLVARAAKGSVAGSLTAWLSEPTAYRPILTAVLQSMYVRPEFRSSGTGATLVAAFRAWARDKGVERVSVAAYADNEAAIRFYQRQGFAPYTLTLELTP